MKAVIKNATILCSPSPYHNSVQDIFIDDGIIKKIGTSLSVNDVQEINYPGLHVSAGWMDIFSNFCEPGNEHKETLFSGTKAAAAGGFTHVMTVPDTNPAVDSKSSVRFLIEKSKSLPASILPVASVTKNNEGKELSEMYDMYESGAVAFSNGFKSLQDPGITLKALQYLLANDTTLIQVPDYTSIAPHALMNEGIISTQLGLPGKPAVAEELMIMRDIELAAYTKSKLHITGFSTAASLQLITEAKSKGINITCSVTPYHLFFCDEDLNGYDTNLKVNPPLRTKADVTALQKGFSAGSIDCIASHHQPQHADDKDCEFEYAKNGMISLQNVFGIASQFAGTEMLIEMLTNNPRKIFNIPQPLIAEGTNASLTLFHPNETYIFEHSMIRSLCFNSPFVGKQMKGKVIGTIHNNKLNLLNE